jgi:DnaJ-domain-containing protein 1
MFYFSVDFDIPFEFAKNIMLRWPDYLFFIEGFDLVSAEIVKEEKNIVYFFAKTVEFMLFPLFIAGKTTVLDKKVVFAFFPQWKKFNSFNTIIEKADIASYSFTYKFEQKKLSILTDTSVISDDKAMKKALKTVAFGIEIQYYIAYADKLLTFADAKQFEYNCNNFKTDIQNKSNLVAGSNLYGCGFDFLEQSESVISAFKLLQLTPTRNVKKIKTAFRKLAREKHPDKIKDKKLKMYANREFIEISAAYKTILNWLATN